MWYIDSGRVHTVEVCGASGARNLGTC